MTSLWGRTRTGGGAQDPRRSDSPITVDGWLNQLKFANQTYGTLPLQQTMPGEPVEPIDSDYEGYVRGAYKANGIVFACMAARQLLFSEARFQFRARKDGRPGKFFGTPALAQLETPTASTTTGQMLSRAIQDVDLAGNWYLARREHGLVRLRPDWVTIVMGSKSGLEVDTELVGYAYQPGGAASKSKKVILLPDEVAHWAPIPDPLAKFRGMSWLTPVVREIEADAAATTHKLKFFENGATPNVVVSLDPKITADAFNRWTDIFEENHTGVINAYKTLYLGGGADAKVIGSDLKQVDFKVTQGAGETRIAAAAGIPPIIVGLSEGLQAATYSNYGQARRRLADGTIRPLWRGVAGALAPLVDVPRDAELWYDDRDIPFLQEDVKDAADIQQMEAATVKQLIDAGFTPKSVIEAVTSQDFALLEHTGLFSIQLQPPGANEPGT